MNIEPYNNDNNIMMSLSFVCAIAIATLTIIMFASVSWHAMNFNTSGTPLSDGGIAKTNRNYRLTRYC